MTELHDGIRVMQAPRAWQSTGSVASYKARNHQAGCHCDARPVREQALAMEAL
jgi:hypothetical protein